MHINLKQSYLLLIFLMVQVSHGQKQQLPEWQPGFLDIHHINTGRGDAAFMVFPDGTTFLVDAGDMSETHPRTTSSRNAKLLPKSLSNSGDFVAT